LRRLFVDTGPLLARHTGAREAGLCAREVLTFDEDFRRAGFTLFEQ